MRYVKCTTATSGINIKKKASVLVVKKLDYGCSYKEGFFFAIDFNEDDLPMFQKIIKLFIHKNRPYCIAVLWETLNYNENFCAFEITEKSAEKYSVVDIATLQHRVMYEIHQPYNSVDNYIVPKYNIPTTTMGMA